VAWGAIDAVLYWLACFHAHGQKIVALRAAREEEDPDQAYRVIADALPPVLASVTTPVEFEAMRRKLRQLPDPPQRPHITKEEWLAGLGIFLLVVVATLPVVLPFLFIHDPVRALRFSNGIAILLLFLTGYIYGRQTGYRPLTSGLILIVIGVAMVGTTIALGG
jgi:VIT1/CCC1 family predicted Fe2+/Mn2+ transporter